MHMMVDDACWSSIGWYGFSKPRAVGYVDSLHREIRMVVG